MRCPICEQDHEKLLHNFNNACDLPIFEELQRKVPHWHPTQGVCHRCTDQAQVTALTNSGSIDFGVTIQGNKILPIPTRLLAHPSYTGKGVTIGFIDSGFYPHPDLKGRITAVIDITNDKILHTQTYQTHSSDWHGTMTAVVGAGNGTLSNGIYKSLASDANVILLKVMDTKGIINGENITKALEWTIKNREKYNIRVVSLSVTDDQATSYRENAVDIAVARAVEAGIVVVAAAGNDTHANLKAPANSPHAITIGGLDDHNTLHPLASTLYHSTFGETIDGTHKPELIARAVWIPTPILPRTSAQHEAALLFNLLQISDERYVKAAFANVITQLNIDKKLVNASTEMIRLWATNEISNRKLISPHYQHADGTSFAAPIVSSLVAQMLEANPTLTPAAIRDILIRTARRLEQVPATRQGFGVVHPMSAVYHAETEHHALPALFTPIVNYQQHKVEFYLHDHEAKTVSALGDFNNWDAHTIRLQQGGDGHWRANYPLPPKGTYRYKLLIDQQRLIPDPTNLFRETDGFGGFNSKLIIE